MNIEYFQTWFSPGINTSILLVILLTFFIVLMYQKIRRLSPTDRSTGMVMALELLVDFINKFAKEHFGGYWKFYAPILLTLGLYLTFANTMGLFGIRPPTSSINVTLGLSILAFFLIQGTGIVTKGGVGYIKGLFEPLPFMFPLNVIGELAVPISLGLRLFGNIFSGVIITGLVYAALGNFAPIVTPLVHAIFDVFFGLIQVVVFILLVTIFSSNSLASEKQ
jgi:F-type H+-transporting ATPase subunit a